MPSRTRHKALDLIATCDALVAMRTTAAIAQYGYYRGHPVVCLEGEACERYAQDLTSTVDAQGVSVEWPCVQCRALAAPDGPDPCLGMLPGVVAACCGHGTVDEAYVLFRFPQRHMPGARRDVLRREEALQYFKDQGVGPAAACLRKA